MNRTFTVLLLLLITVACKEHQRKLETYKILGDSVATAAQQALIVQLMDAINKNGPAYAIEFCNERAIHLTDSIASAFNCNIKRVALRNRNPQNALTQQDEKVFAAYQQQWDSKDKMNPTIIDQKSEILFYKPIVLGMPQCLNCHGDTANLSDDVKTILAERYPHDKATGFKQGDLRGLWKITFKRN